MSSIRTQQSARDLGAVIDSRLHSQSMLPLFAWAATINCVNCDKPSDDRQWMPPGRWSRLSLPVTWTGATHCSTASLMNWCDVCSQADHWHITMWPHLTSASPAAVASSASATRSPRLFIGVCLATSQATWLTTADSSPTPVSDDCILPTLEQWSSVAHKVLLAIGIRCGSTSSLEQFGVWRQPDLSYGQFMAVT